MNDDDYQELLGRYLDGAISSREFQHLYLQKFKNESRPLPEHVFEVLDSLFSDVDAFCPDVRLLVDLNRANPDFYLNEHVLRQRVSEAFKRLKDITIPRESSRVL